MTTCPGSHSTRRSTRRVRPGDRLAESAKLPLFHTASTGPSSSRSGDGGRSPVSPADNRFLQLQRKICPITGKYREISGDYRVDSAVLGRGRYGVVRKCKHRATRRALAVKSVDKSKINRLDHLRREVRLLRKMDHRGIIKMVDCCEDANNLHIVTERYTGGELFDRIKKKTTPDGCFSEHEAAKIIKSLLEAVAYLHDNDVVHRDIKPDNILFESSKKRASIRVVDFGLSRKHRSGEKPMDSVVGTTYYMAPEVLERRYGRSCDVWSVGVVAYILLCGHPPFDGETDLEIVGKVREGNFAFSPAAAWSSKSDGAKDFISRLLTMDPSERPTSREALGHAWLEANAGKGVKSNDVKQHEDFMAMIQSLRTSLSLRNRR